MKNKTRLIHFHIEAFDSKISMNKMDSTYNELSQNNFHSRQQSMVTTNMEAYDGKRLSVVTEFGKHHRNRP
jgi:hypothetical protein